MKADPRLMGSRGPKETPAIVRIATEHTVVAEAEGISLQVTGNSDYRQKLYDPATVRENSTFGEHKAAITELLNAGPGQWVPLKKVDGKFGFLRGLTGYPEGGPFAEVQESLDLLLGKKSAYLRTVSLMEHSDETLVQEFAGRVNASYANPLTVKGRVDSFADVDYMGPVTQQNVDAIANSKSFEDLDRHQCVPQLAAGWSIDHVSDVAILLPPSHSPGTSIVGWALNTMAFYQQFMLAGIELQKDSKGGKFYGQLVEILGKYENLQPENYYGVDGPSQKHDRELQAELVAFFAREQAVAATPGAS
jgi:hypothetical protein